MDLTDSLLTHVRFAPCPCRMLKNFSWNFNKITENRHFPLKFILFTLKKEQSLFKSLSFIIFKNTDLLGSNIIFLLTFEFNIIHAEAHIHGIRLFRNIFKHHLEIFSVCFPFASFSFEMERERRYTLKKY